MLKLVIKFLKIIEVSLMEHFCPECMDIKECTITVVSEEKEIEGVKIKMDAKYLQCEECKSLVPNSELEEERYNEMYKKYEEKTGIDLKVKSNS